MHFLAVDDEEIMLNHLENMLRRIRPKAEIFSFTWPEDALEAAKREQIDVALLDIEMGSLIKALQIK